MHKATKQIEATNSEKEEIKRLFLYTDTSLEDIARQLALPRRCVERSLDSLRIRKFRRKNYYKWLEQSGQTPISKKKLKQLYCKEKVAIIEMHRRYGKSTRFFRDWLIDLGLLVECDCFKWDKDKTEELRILCQDTDLYIHEIIDRFCNRYPDASSHGVRDKIFKTGYNLLRSKEKQNENRVDDESKAFIVQLYSQGVKIEDIGEAVGLPSANIYGHLKNVPLRSKGYKFLPDNKSINDNIISLHNNELTQQEIANIFNVSEGTVRRRFKKLKLKARGQHSVIREYADYEKKGLDLVSWIDDYCVKAHNITVSAERNRTTHTVISKYLKPFYLIRTRPEGIKLGKYKKSIKNQSSKSESTDSEQTQRIEKKNLLPYHTDLINEHYDNIDKKLFVLRNKPLVKYLMQTGHSFEDIKADILSHLVEVALEYDSNRNKRFDMYAIKFCYWRWIQTIRTQGVVSKYTMRRHKIYVNALDKARKLEKYLNVLDDEAVLDILEEEGQDNIDKIIKDYHIMNVAQNSQTIHAQDDDRGSAILLESGEESSSIDLSKNSDWDIVKRQLIKDVIDFQLLSNNAYAKAACAMVCCRILPTAEGNYSSTMLDISERIGVSQTSLCHYYKDLLKDEHFVEIIHQAISDFGLELGKYAFANK